MIVGRPDRARKIDEDDAAIEAFDGVAWRDRVRLSVMIVIRLFRILIYSVLAFFSIFGALASFEPTSSGSIHGGWLVFYLGLFVATLSGIIYDIRGIVRSRKPGAEASPESSSPPH